MRPWEQARKADPTLQRFVDRLREVLDKDPLYDRRYIPDAERFYMPAMRALTDGRTPRAPTT